MQMDVEMKCKSMAWGQEVCSYIGDHGSYAKWQIMPSTLSTMCKMRKDALRSFSVKLTKWTWIGPI